MKQKYYSQYNYYLRNKKKLHQYYLKNKKRIIEYGKEWRKKNPQKRKEQTKRYRQKHKERIKQYLQNYRKEHKEWALKLVLKYKLRKIEFLGGRCKKCGNEDIRVLEIHHKRYKRKERTVSLTELKKDRKNFVLLCANCHSILHWNKTKFNLIYKSLQKHKFKKG